jgi:hypothetical protein
MEAQGMSEGFVGFADNPPRLHALVRNITWRGNKDLDRSIQISHESNVATEDIALQ